MANRDKHEAVSIRPGVRVLSVLRHLNYKPWFALAEFVDNALQSYAKRACKPIGKCRLGRVEKP